MEITSNLPALSDPGAGAPAKRDDPEKIREAATQFEALLIGQMMRTVRESGGGWMGSGDSGASGIAMDMAEQQFAQSMASQGGLGLARLVMNGLQTAEKAASTRD
jgi:peptidoglycan hydrolase FlgJ